MKKYVFFNELLYSIVRPMYGSHIRLNEMMTKAERKFRKKLMKNAKHIAKSYYTTTNVLHPLPIGEVHIQSLHLPNGHARLAQTVAAVQG